MARASYQQIPDIVLGSFHKKPAKVKLKKPKPVKGASFSTFSSVEKPDRVKKPILKLKF